MHLPVRLQKERKSWPKKGTCRDSKNFNDVFVFSKDQIDAPMGQIISKRNVRSPTVRFSTQNEGPPQYSPHDFDGRNQNLQIPPTVIEDFMLVP